MFILSLGVRFVCVDGEDAQKKDGMVCWIILYGAIFLAISMWQVAGYFRQGCLSKFLM